jgi:MoxR-like ATPase
MADAYTRIKSEVHHRIVGMDDVIDLLLFGILSGGHCLLMGVPGLAKTLLLSSLSELLDLKFSRIQFTPDLMPSDIVGTEVITENPDTAERQFRLMTGPIFANIVLADEINRTPPKTQAALMEAMEEHQVTIGGRTHPLAAPFFVLATQNPIEQEGTYPLPAAQLDRFTFLIQVSYPSRQEEYTIIRRTTTSRPKSLSPVLAGGEILQMMALVRREPAPADVVAFATESARATRPQDADPNSRVAQYLSFGVGPRGAQSVVLAAKVRALLQGRRHPNRSDVEALIPHAFGHRMILNFRAAAEGVTVTDILHDILSGQAASPRGKSRAR